ADHGQAHLLAPGQLQQALDIVHRDVGIAYTRFTCGAGIAGGHDHLIDLHRLPELPRQRVFAPAAADHQNLHACTPARHTTQLRIVAAATGSPPVLNRGFAAAPATPPAAA